jgi:hypothetical protein
MPALTVLRLSFSALWMVVFAYAAYASLSFPSISGMYPRVAACGGLILASVTLLMDLVKWRRGHDVVASDSSNSSTAALAAESDGSVGRAFLRAARYGLWLLALMLLFWLIGAVAAAGIFLFAFLKIESNARWPLLVAGPIVTMVLLLLLSHQINLIWPDSLYPLIY